MKSMNKNKVRDRILREESKENKTDDENLRRFFQLLERLKRGNKELINYNAITEDEQKEVIKNSKKTSVSSIFSKRVYLVHKIILESEKMVEVLIRFYKVVIKEEIILERQKDVLNTMAEKGK